MRSIMTVFLVMAAATAFGQDKTQTEKEKNFEEKHEKIEKLKIAYLTTELDLTSAEAEKFWPIYNEQENKLKELRKSGKEASKKVHENFEELTDAEAKKAMETMYENEVKENALRKEYSEKFITVIGAKRTLKLMHAEHEFKRELLERLKDQHDGPHDKGPHGKR